MMHVCVTQAEVVNPRLGGENFDDKIVSGACSAMCWMHVRACAYGMLCVHVSSP